MRKSTLIAAAATSLLFTGTAAAQSFTYDVLWEPVESVGGMMGPSGPAGGAGIVNGTYKTTFEDGSVQEGKVRCVGMQQPDNGMFAIHMSCSTTDGNGEAAIVYGCNYLGKPGPETPLGCVGGIQGKTGDSKGRRGSLTMEWYSAANSRGTGQWYSGE